MKKKSRHKELYECTNLKFDAQNWEVYARSQIDALKLNTKFLMHLIAQILQLKDQNYHLGDNE